MFEGGAVEAGLAQVEAVELEVEVARLAHVGLDAGKVELLAELRRVRVAGVALVGLVAGEVVDVRAEGAGVAVEAYGVVNRFLQKGRGGVRQNGADRLLHRVDVLDRLDVTGRLQAGGAAGESHGVKPGAQAVRLRRRVQGGLVGPEHDFLAAAVLQFDVGLAA